ncbi:uncharacterized protein LOC141719617 [Apium graveolens]|uniref:uncharacterized protein LOC141719617 n=1 Tax=Apium graveolens TaxID=4045 RepID=UPI003D7992E4
MVVANDMRNCGEDMSDVKIVEKILRTLIEKFNYVVCSIEESKDIDSLSVDALQSSLLVHEQKFKKVGGEEQVLKVSYEERTVRGRGFAARDRRGGRSRQAFNKAIVECFKCHNIGYYQYECPKWNKQASYVESKEEEELLLMDQVEDVREKKYDVWFLDSGCSNHMSGDKELFSSLNENFRHSVKLGNNTRMKVVGKGSIKLPLNDMMSTITEVYYVIELKKNLLSLGQLQEKGVGVKPNSTVKDLLIQRGLYATLGGKKPTEVDDTKWGDMKLRAASTIRLALAPEIKYDVLEEDNPKNLWEKLTKTYHSKSLLNNLDEKLKDEDKAVLLLVSLPKKHNTVMTSLLVGKTKLDLDETIVVLLEAERLMKQESSDTSDGSAFVAREDLRELKKNRGGSVSLVEADEDVLLVQEEKGSKEEWVFDSGCSHHICGRREWFSSYKKCEGKIVTLPNGKTVKVAGIGELWHERNGHLSYRGLKILHDNKMVIGLPRIEDTTKTCVDCFEGKQQRKAIPKQSMWRAKEVLELIHSDICGPISPASSSDFVEKKSSGQIKCLRTDRSGEFTSDDFNNFCKEHGIQRQLTTAYTSQQNGVAERKNRTVMNMILHLKKYGAEKSLQLNTSELGDALLMYTYQKPKEVWSVDENDENALSSDGGKTARNTSENIIEDEGNKEGENVIGGAGSREGRIRKVPAYLSDYFNGDDLSEEEIEVNMAEIESLEATDPSTFEEAVTSKLWIEAMDVEIDAINKNHTWELTSLPKGAKCIGVSNDNLMMQKFKSSMQREFDMTDLGKMRLFLEIEVMQTYKEIHISQHKYAVELLRRFGMEDCNEAYKATFLAAKRALRYLKGTLDYSIWYKRGGIAGLKVFTRIVIMQGTSIEGRALQVIHL